MRIAAIKIIIFTIFFVLIDLLSRPVFMSLMANAKPSAMKNMYDITINCKKDIIVLGSSRAMHHYDSRIIADSLKMTCLNCGAMSNGIVLMYGRYKLLTRHHNPKIIIYDVHPPFDLIESDNSKYIPTLRPFAEDASIKKLFSRIDKWENLKCLCSLYRFNSLLPELLSVNFKEDQSLFDGYAPLYNIKEFTPPISQQTKKNIDIKYDSLKISLFKEMIEDCQKRNIKLVFVISPSYHKNLIEEAEPIFQLCNEYKTPLLCYDSGRFPIEEKYFFDSFHLNDLGAKHFTHMFVSDLLKYQY